jgi:hypothetical protein
MAKLTLKEEVKHLYISYTVHLPNKVTVTCNFVKNSSTHNLVKHFIEIVRSLARHAKAARILARILARIFACSLNIFLSLKESSWVK